MSYTIDYTTERPQANSLFCAIPDEILLKIAEPLFNGFGLQFRAVVDRRGICHSATVSSVPSFDADGLSILRLCKLIRRKLLPTLAVAMSDRLNTDSPWYKNRSTPAHGGKYADRLYRTPSISPLMRSRVRRLQFAFDSGLILDPELFENLSEIVINETPPPFLELAPTVDLAASTKQNEWLLLLISRGAAGESLNPVEEVLFEQNCDWDAEECWISELISLAKISSALAGVQIILTHPLLRSGVPKWVMQYLLLRDVRSGQMVVAKLAGDGIPRAVQVRDQNALEHVGLDLLRKTLEETASQLN